MKVIAVMNAKGGVGKTTLCAHIAWYLAAQDRGNVLAVDLDQQANLTHTMRDACPAGSAVSLFEPGISMVAAATLSIAGADPAIMDIEQTRDEAVPLAFRGNMRSSAPHFRACVIDTPPQLGVRTIAATIAADVVLAPIGLGDYSILGIEKLIEFQAAVAELYVIEPPKFLGLLPSIYDRKSPRERALFDQLQREAADMLCPVAVAKRDAYARAASEGRPVWEMPGTASREAAAEIRGVVEWIEREIGL